MKISPLSLSISKATIFSAVISVLALAHGLQAEDSLFSSDILVGSESKSGISVGWIEYFLVLILILMNVYISYTVFLRFDKAMRRTKRSLVMILSSMLMLLLWAGFRLTQLLGTSSIRFLDSVLYSYNWVFLVAVLAVAMIVLIICCGFSRNKPCITMSPSSKMVSYDGEWISIEEYLSKEMGINVSHGMTKEDLNEAIKAYHDDVAKNGIPRPKDS